MQTTDEKWMHIALKQAKIAQNMDEVPVGAALVKDNQLITEAHNQPIATFDATAHAEIVLLRKAGKVLNNYRLPSTTLYVTLEPCSMCLSAMVHARIMRVVFGAFDKKTGACGSCMNLVKSECFNHNILTEGGVLLTESRHLLQEFFRKKRKSIT
jgi:tRNA(adenine34) deaminase